VVADRVVLSGTTRALNDETYDRNIGRIESICRNLATMHDTAIDFKVEHAVPVTRNDPRITAVAREAAAKIFPPPGIVAVPPMLGGEDFAYIAARIPSCFALLGTKDPQQDATSLHHPRMLLDEAALPFGAAFLAQAAVDVLASFP
jgi:amidohydrolase